MVHYYNTNLFASKEMPSEYYDKKLEGKIQRCMCTLIYCVLVYDTKQSCVSDPLVWLPVCRA